jgi:hypothetical protein
VAFLEAMNQTMASTLFYGNPGTDPKTYLGLAPRFSSKSATNGQNILDGGGVSTNNASIWLVVWGKNTVFCPFPKGSKAGLQHEDLGEDTVIDRRQRRPLPGAAHPLPVEERPRREGLALRGAHRQHQHANLVAESSAANLIKLMTRALFRVPNLRDGRPVFYMNRTVAQMLPIQGLNNSLQRGEGAGGHQPVRRAHRRADVLPGVPIRLCDQLLNTEAQVT